MPDFLASHQYHTIHEIMISCVRRKTQLNLCLALGNPLLVCGLVGIWPIFLRIRIRPHVHNAFTFAPSNFVLYVRDYDTQPARRETELLTPDWCRSQKTLRCDRDRDFCQFRSLACDDQKPNLAQ